MDGGSVIAPAFGPADLDAVRLLFHEYARSLPFSLEFQGFPAELAGLPEPYVAPGGGLWLACRGGEPVGVVGLKPLSRGIGEVKRLYVVPQARGTGLGRRLAKRAVNEAKARGYQRVRLDTHRPSMAGAIALYRSLGFVEIPPYGPDLGGDIAFFEKPL